KASAGGSAPQACADDENKRAFLLDQPIRLRSHRFIVSSWFAPHYRGCSARRCRRFIRALLGRHTFHSGVHRNERGQFCYCIDPSFWPFEALWKDSAVLISRAFSVLKISQNFDFWLFRIFCVVHFFDFRFSQKNLSPHSPAPRATWRPLPA